jgi:membrane fusion protein (multidrug efflux system)
MRAVVERWTFERDRVKALFDQDKGSHKELHDAQMELLAAEGRLAQEGARLKMARAGPRKEELDAARSEVAAQSALVRRLEREVKLMEIRAPFDGFVVLRRAEIGEWIEEGGPVCEMVAMETVRVRADVPESAARFARAGEPATVEIEAFGESRSGKISRLIPRATQQARTFPVEIDLPNADHALLPGLFAWVHVPAGTHERRLLAPKDAIVTHGMDKTIFVVRAGPDGAQTAMPLRAETGIELGGVIEVRAEGLAAGDLVVVRANERLFGPTPVIASPPAASRPAAEAAVK